MFEILSDFLKTQDVEYALDARLCNISPIKIGGKACCLVYPGSRVALINLLKFLREHKFGYKIFGRMSNVLLVREYYDTVVIRTDRLHSYSVDNEILSAECGLLLASAAMQLAELGYGGISELCGIPGSIGGLVRTCAGAYGKDISDILLSIDVYDPVNNICYEIGREDIAFSYRHCPLDESLAVLGAKIRLSKDSPEKIKAEISNFRHRRASAQPTSSLTLGSTFKRPSGAYAAQLIDEAGLKGRSVGGAVISEKHAGFIVNSGCATAQDVLSLMDIAAKEVYSRYVIRLEPEIEMF